MKNKFFLVGFLTVIMVMCMSFQLPKNLLKKVNKELKRAYEIENLQLESVKISNDNIADRLSIIDSTTLFKIIENQSIVGYAYIAKAPSKTDNFDYLVLFDTDFVIKKAKVLVYREDYGAEIGSKRWLKQFIGKKTSSEIKYEKDIIAISGATISARSMTVAINNLLFSLSQLQKQGIL